MTHPRFTTDLHFIVAVKGCERYVLVYPSGEEYEAGKAVANWCSNPELEFGVVEAKAMAESIGREMAGGGGG